MKFSLIALLFFVLADVAAARDVTLAWPDTYWTEEPTAVGIHVYSQEFDYGDSACQSDTTVRQTNAPVPPPASSHTVAGLDDAITYCLWIRGINAQGLESDYSNGVMFFAPQLPFSGPADVRISP